MVAARIVVGRPVVVDRPKDVGRPEDMYQVILFNDDAVFFF